MGYMSFIYTAFGDKLYIENFSDTDKKEKDTDKKEKNINKNECKEVTDNIDFNVYSHIRIYDLDHKHYITLYPHYLTEHKHKCTGSFGLFIKKNLKNLLSLQRNLLKF